MSIYDKCDLCFCGLIYFNVQFCQIGVGFEWIEGLVWFFVVQMLLFFDIFVYCMMCWIVQIGCLIFCEDLGYFNGNICDGQGCFVICYYGLCVVIWIEYDGMLIMLVN